MPSFVIAQKETTFVIQNEPTTLVLRTVVRKVPWTTPITVTGSRGGNAALASLLTALETQGLVLDNTTA